MNRFSSSRSSCVLSVLLAAASTNATLIDNFNVSQGQLTVSGFALDNSSVSGSGILGFERDLGMVGGAGSTGIATVAVTNGAVNFNAAGQVGANANQPAVFILEYDGNLDGGVFSTDTDGLGGEDLTEQSRVAGVVFDFQYLIYNFEAGDSSFNVVMRDIDGRFAIVGIENVDIRSAAPFALFIPFDESLPGSSVDSGFRFGALGSVSVQFRAHEALFQLTSIYTGIQQINLIDDFAAPQPTLSVDGFSIAESAAADYRVLAGERDLGILGGSGSTGLAMVRIQDGAVRFDATNQTGANANQPALFVLDYDGDEDGGSSSSSAAFGLGGVDLTNGGQGDGIAFCFESLKYLPSAGTHSFAISFTDIDNRFALLVVQDVDVQSSVPSTLFLPFDGSSPGSTIDAGFRFDAVGSMRPQFQAHEMVFELSAISTGTESDNACSNLSATCTGVDTDQDGDVDLSDYRMLQACFTGG